MYSYSEEGMQVYKSFANEMAQIMNESGMHNVGSHQQQDSESQTQTLSGHIFMTKGAFCTPRSVVRGLTTRLKTTTLQVMEEMKRLDEEGVGNFKHYQIKKKLFTSPSQLIETKINLLYTNYYVNFDEYADNFMKTIAQSSHTIQ